MSVIFGLAHINITLWIVFSVLAVIPVHTPPQQKSFHSISNNVMHSIKRIYGCKTEQGRSDQRPHSCCVFAAHLAVTVSTRLVTVGVKALIRVTVTRATCRRPPPTPGTLMVNPTRPKKAGTDASTAEWVCRITQSKHKSASVITQTCENAARTFVHLLQAWIIVCRVIKDNTRDLNTARDSAILFIPVDTVAYFHYGFVAWVYFGVLTRQSSYGGRAKDSVRVKNIKRHGK